MPIWQKVTALPERVDALERRLKALEASAAANPVRNQGEPCAYCHGPMRQISEKPHDVFGDLGAREVVLQCQNPNCGKTTTRMLNR